MSEKPSPNILKLLKSVIELAMPDMRHYYRMTRKARVVASYASDGNYYADVQPLRNDETDDKKEPLISKVEIPIIWGGPKRGIVCPPTVGTLCDLSYYDGDPNYPRISNFRWQGNEAPVVELEELIIQKEPGVSIKIDAKNKIVTITPDSVDTDAGKDWTVKAGQNVLVEAMQSATVKAPQINLVGNISASSEGGGAGEINETADRNQTGDYVLQGNITVSGSISAGSLNVSGNSYAGSRSGGGI